MAMLVGAIGTSCVPTTKVYRSPFYKMNKREPVYIEKSDSSYIYSDAMLERTGDVVKAVPDKKVAAVSRIDSALYLQLKSLKYKPELVSKGWRNDKKGLVITYKDYWINESSPSFLRLWLKGLSLKDSTNIMVYEGAPIQSVTKVTPDREVKQSILELLTPGIEQEPDETDFYIQNDDQLIPKSKFYFAFNYSYAKWFGNSLTNVDPSESAHRDDLKSGNAFSGDLAYFFLPYYGAGITASSFSSKNIKGIIRDQQAGTSRNLSDQVNILYVGPTFYVRNLFLKGRMSTIFSISGGYISYKDNQKEYTNSDFSDSNPLKNNMSSSGLGGKLGVSLEYLITPYLGVGASTGLTLGRLKVTDARATDQQNQNLWMNNFTIGVGIRLYK